VGVHVCLLTYESVVTHLDTHHQGRGGEYMTSWTDVTSMSSTIGQGRTGIRIWLVASAPVSCQGQLDGSSAWNGGAASGAAVL